MKRLLPVILVFCVMLTSCNAYYRSKYPREYSETVAEYASEYGVPEEIIYAVIKCESDFNPDAVSSAGACGLMQIMPKTYEWLTRLMGTEYDPDTIFDPDSNIRSGVYMLSYLYRLFGCWETVYAAYNAGQGTVGGWLADTRYSADGVTLSDIPYPETERYVDRVADAREHYSELYYNDEDE